MLSGRALSPDTPPTFAQVIEIQVISRPPRHHVIRARGIAAHADGADHHSRGTIQRQSSTEDVDSADSETQHRIDGRAVAVWRPCVCDVRIHRIALLQAEQAAAGLNSRIKIGRR